MPVLTIFAGPNGSGKSSIIGGVEFVKSENLLETDAIARQIDAMNPRRVAITAGREVLRRTRQYIDSGQHFAIETTLAGNWTLNAIKIALAQGFFVRVVYIYVENPERCIQRVHERVAQGGHDVPDEDVRRRYARSLSNLKLILHIVNQTIIFDKLGA